MERLCNPRKVPDKMPIVGFKSQELAHSCIDVSFGNSFSAETCSGFGRTPPGVIRCRRYSTVLQMKWHLEGLSFSPALCSRSMTARRWLIWSSNVREKMSISSVYAETKGGPFSGFSPRSTCFQTKRHNLKLIQTLMGDSLLYGVAVNLSLPRPGLELRRTWTVQVDLKDHRSWVEGTDLT